MFVLAVLAQFVACDIYAVLIAGSDGFRNYRHQADVFQAYQLLLKRKIKPSNIILFAYDDIVDCPENPMPGRVFSLKKHVNVYPGRDRIDYRGKNVTPRVIEAVLTGDKATAGGRVLNSTENDDVFIYYNDHGTSGFLCMPGHGPLWSASDVRQTILTMQEKKMFRQLFFTIEACFSGSVGRELADIPNVSVLTAANAVQSSYSYGWDDTIRTFRTNEFSYSFFKTLLKYPDATLRELFLKTKEMTKGSEVQSFGNETIKIENFLGSDEPIDMGFENAEFIEDNSPKVTNIDATIEALKRRIRSATTSDELKFWQNLLRAELMRRGTSKLVMNKIALPFTGGNVKETAESYPEHPQWKCYEDTLAAFRKSCGELGEYELARVSMFAKICEEHDASEIIDRIKTVCPVQMWDL